MLDANRNIVVTGFTTRSATEGGRSIAVARYDPNGQLDPSFGAGGIAVIRVAPDGRTDASSGLDLDTAGRVLIGGQADMGPSMGGFNFAVVRLDPDGTLDSAFDGDGMVTTAMAPGDGFEAGFRLVTDSAGRIVLGGIAESRRVDSASTSPWLATRRMGLSTLRSMATGGSSPISDRATPMPSCRD